ncbi:MAG: hypothetical protein K8T26_11230 [Lentisphaerae bacterium]|nr:hypothetical protein [Lentisphaerota bacterium]
MPYTTPFCVKDGTIHDACGEKVKLWGVNYYAPFNHNYCNIEELGKDHFRAIDEDLRHLKLLGVDLIRLHLYEREITDRHGNIVEGHNLEVFDYLIEQCERQGIFLMLTLMTWYNTIKNQIGQERSYAYWYVAPDDPVGFSNFYSCDAMIWDSEAIACQKTYLRGLFTRQSTVSGKRLSEHRQIVVLELLNEPQYPHPWMLAGDPEITAANMGAAMFSRGAQRLKFVDLWNTFSATLPASLTTAEKFSRFRANTVGSYFAELLPIVRQHFSDTAILAHYTSEHGQPDEDLKETISAAGFSAYTLATYLNASGFDADNTDLVNHLAMARRMFDQVSPGAYGAAAKIAYEFDATGTQNGYPLAAIAAMYARHEVQIAAYFTYTPAAVASWNPGWLLHFLNLQHTPSRAAGFAAAGEIFRRLGPGNDIHMEEHAWRGPGYAIERKDDLVTFKSESVYRYSNSHDLDLGDASTLTHVSGRGTSRFASSDGNGFYALTKTGTKTWRLCLYPSQQFVAPPGRGKAFRGMANRYVNCLKEPAVSILREDLITFRLVALSTAAVRDVDTGMPLPVRPDGSFAARPGTYDITVT